MSHDTTQNEASRSSIGLRSRTSVGIITSRISQLFGGSHSIQVIGQFLRRRLWAWPIIAAVLLGGAGWWVYDSVEEAMRRQRVIDLTTILDASVTSLRSWMGEQEVNLKLIADDEQLRRSVHELLKLAGGNQPERDLLLAKAQTDVRARLKPRLQTTGYIGFIIVNRHEIQIASDRDQVIGKALEGPYRLDFFARALAGEFLVTKPYRSAYLQADDKGELRANLPTMYVVGPIRDDSAQVIAAVALRIRPQDQFTRILQVARFGSSGETYAFDRKGLLLSQSRFDNDLKQIGLLLDQEGSESILSVEIRDPQVNMMAGGRPSSRRSAQPLTRMATEAVQGKDGHDADGYRDYRGVPTVGAWRWLNDYDLGVATEIDVAEAFQPVYILRRAIGVLMALLILAAIGIFLAMLFIARQQRALQNAALEAKQLGQYALEEKLGAGGMGTVYKARHAMLRRPTAVKLLDVDKMSPAAITRFEREVQLTSTLTHPNTVAIFDYGRTPEGIFYYAMEYLEGMNLENLVKRFGSLPEERLVYILRQLCGSLAEAHAAGLIHRDIKPANIFLTCRGGIYDFVKVLDFGLVKALDGPERGQLTSADAITGTPLYLSPEAIDKPTSVDARADVYAIGAVGYFLLTATPVFDGATIMEICLKHVREMPELPSLRCGRPVSPGLEALLVRCLAKSPAERPRDATQLLNELESLHLDAQWTRIDAEAWWVSHWQPKTGAPTQLDMRGSVHSSALKPTSAPDTTVYVDGPTDERQGEKTILE